MRITCEPVEREVEWVTGCKGARQVERNVEDQGHHDRRLPAVVVGGVAADCGAEAVNEGSRTRGYRAEMRPPAN